MHGDGLSALRWDNFRRRYCSAFSWVMNSADKQLPCIALKVFTCFAVRNTYKNGGLVFAAYSFGRAPSLRVARCALLSEHRRGEVSIAFSNLADELACTDGHMLYVETSKIGIVS